MRVGPTSETPTVCANHEIVNVRRTTKIVDKHLKAQVVSRISTQMPITKCHYRQIMTAAW